MVNWIIFTDLDGTLLDRHTYSWSEASSALDRLQNDRIPIVFCSSKTRAEQSFYQQQLSLHHPCIVENGSAIFIPNNYFPRESMPIFKMIEDQWIIELGFDASVIQSKLKQIRKTTGLSFLRYADMNDQELSELTGLQGDDVARARQRQYSETIAADFTADQSSLFQQALNAEKLTCVSGGHLQTVTSIASNKGRAVRILTDLYRQLYGDVITVGLGDSPNDRTMLEQTDIRYQVQRPDETWFDMDLPDIRRVGVGPRGWQQAIESLLEGSSVKRGDPSQHGVQSQPAKET